MAGSRAAPRTKHAPSRFVDPRMVRLALRGLTGVGHRNSDSTESRVRHDSRPRPESDRRRPPQSWTRSRAEWMIAATTRAAATLGVMAHGFYAGYAAPPLMPRLSSRAVWVAIPVRPFPSRRDPVVPAGRTMPRDGQAIALDGGRDHARAAPATGLRRQDTFVRGLSADRPLVPLATMDPRNSAMLRAGPGISTIDPARSR